jgi:hypothetical protein
MSRSMTGIMAAGLGGEVRSIAIVAGSTAAIYLFLLVLLRLFGRRQLGQLTVIDLVVVLLLGQRGRDRHDPRPRRRTGGDPGDRRVGERHPPHRPRSGARRAGPEA